MFGKKKPALAPFVMQILTTEYLIEGTAEGDTQLYFPTGRGDWSPITLTAVQIKVLSRTDLPPRSVSQFEISGPGVVAMIPRADASQRAGYESWKLYNQSRSGVFHIGPYLIRGQMMFLREDRIDEVTPMVDVQIMHQSPEAAMGELSAPFILVNTGWMYGYEPA